MILQHREFVEQFHGHDQAQSGFRSARDGGEAGMISALFAMAFDAVFSEKLRRIDVTEPEIDRKRFGSQ